MKKWSSTIDCILSTPVPEDTESYCAIPHSVFLTEIKDELVSRGYAISEERYLTTHGCNVVAGVYKVHSDIDSEMCPAVSFVNSYNKMRKAEIRAAAMVLVCRNGMMGTVDNGYYSRKHTGSALEDFREHIKIVINGLDKEFARLVTNKEEMKCVTLTRGEKAQLIGDMLLEKMVTSVQTGILLREVNRSSCSEFKNDSLWSFYNHCTESFKNSHPMFFDKQHVKFHTYICDKFQLTGSRGLFDKLLKNGENFVDISNIPGIVMEDDFDEMEKDYETTNNLSS